MVDVSLLPVLQVERIPTNWGLQHDIGAQNKSKRSFGRARIDLFEQMVADNFLYYPVRTVLNFRPLPILQ